MPRLPIADKLLYAVASVGNASLFWSQSLWLLYFYAPPEGEGLPQRMPVALIGILLGIGKLIEVFDDPLVGWWSDRTRSRWGRRIPFLLFGTPILGISFWLIWTPPTEDPSLLNIIYFFVVVEIFFFARTIVEAPYDALQAELVTTSSERVSLGSWKVFFAIVGVVVGLVFSPLLIEAFGFAGMGLILGLVAIGALYVMLFGLWRRGTLTPSTSEAEAAAAAAEEPVPLFASLLGALRSRPFLALAGSFMLFNLGYQLLVLVLPYYLTVVLGGSRGDVTWFTGGVTLLVLLALPPLTLAARRWSKRAIYAGSMAALGAYMVFLTFGAFVPVAPGVSFFVQALALVSLSGLGFAALFLFPGAMVADLIDEDARRTGQGRAAIFYGMFKTLEKIAQAVSVALLGIVLALLGNTAERPHGIQAAMPIAGALVLAGFVVVLVGYHVREARREPLAGAAERVA